MSKRYLTQLKNWLAGLSFRTGICVLIACILCYAISFAQMLLPISVSAKGLIWTIFFGIAKATQYTALLILGKAGIDRVKKYFSTGRTIQKQIT